LDHVFSLGGFFKVNHRLVPCFDLASIHSANSGQKKHPLSCSHLILSALTVTGGLSFSWVHHKICTPAFLNINKIEFLDLFI